MSGPGADLAEELIEKLNPNELDLLQRWGAGDRSWVTGFFFGRFVDSDYPPVCLSNAARAYAAGELKRRLS